MSDKDSLWVVRFTCVSVFVALMMFEWHRWPNGSPLLGPLGVLWYNGLRDYAWAYCLISIVALLAFLIRPHPITAAISLLGVINWLFCGLMAMGIGC